MDPQQLGCEHILIFRACLAGFLSVELSIVEFALPFAFLPSVTLGVLGSRGAQLQWQLVSDHPDFDIGSIPCTKNDQPISLVSGPHGCHASRLAPIA